MIHHHKKRQPEEKAINEGKQKKTTSQILNSCQLPAAAPLGLGHLTHLTFPCWDFDCLQFARGLCMYQQPLLTHMCSCSVYLECKYHTLWKLPGASSSRDLDKEESGAGVAVAPMPTQADTAKLLCLSVW